MAAAVIAGCAPRARSAPPAATPSPAPAPAPAPTATAAPAAERGRERVATSARVSYEIATPRAGTPVGFSGQVEALTSDASARIGATTAPAVPVRFRGSIDARGVHLDLDGSLAACAQPGGEALAGAVATARETVVRVPSAIAVGTRWRDSVTTTVCRGPVPATLTTVARYEITGVDGQRVHVRRDATLRLRGQAIAGGRSVTLAGSGTGTATIDLDAALGRLQRVDGDTRTTITVTLPDGAREFTQQVRTEVRAR